MDFFIPGSDIVFTFSSYDQIVAEHHDDLKREAARLEAREAARAAVVAGDAADAVWAIQDALEGHRTVTPRPAAGGYRW